MGRFGAHIQLSTFKGVGGRLPTTPGAETLPYPLGEQLSVNPASRVAPFVLSIVCANVTTYTVPFHTGNGVYL